MASSPLIVEARLSPSNLCSRLRTAFGVSRQQGWLVGATKPTGRPCRQRTLRCSQGSQGWKLKLVRQGPERWQWSGREQSRAKSLDIRRPIQGRLDEGGDVQPLVAVVAEGDGPLTLGGPHPPDDRLQADAVLVRGPDLNRLVRVLCPLLGDGLLQLF